MIRSASAADAQDPAVVHFLVLRARSVCCSSHVPPYGNNETKSFAAILFVTLKSRERGERWASVNLNYFESLYSLVQNWARLI